jgi:hypothetical protein
MPVFMQEWAIFLTLGKTESCLDIICHFMVKLHVRISKVQKICSTLYHVLSSISETYMLNAMFEEYRARICLQK